jgi:hypothetical protein
LRPFVYSIPTGIYLNKSIPLGLFLFKTETAEVYKAFFRMLLDLGIPIEFLQSKGYLTDEGRGLKSALHEYGFIRFSCYRHLIEKMGSATILGIITRRLLFTSTQYAYEAKLHESILELGQLINNDIINQKQLKKFCKNFDLTITEDKYIEITTLDHHNALGKRAELGIATCSNHLERLHRTLNDAVSEFQIFIRRFSTVVNVILDWPITFTKNQHRQEKLVITNLQKKAADKNITPSETCNSPRCGLSQFYSSLFGIPNFPCVHTVTTQSPLFSEILFPPFFTSGNQIILTAGNQENNQSQRRASISQNQQNETEANEENSGSDMAFLLDTASELMLINSKKFKNKWFSFATVIQQWTMYTEGEIEISDQSDDDEEITDAYSRAEFRIALFTDANIIGTE